MPGYIIAVLAICFISSATFTVVSFKKTLINLYFKTFSSVMFTILGLLSLYTLISHSLELSNNRLIGGFFMVLGLITCMVGDIILGLPKLEETKNSSTAVIIGGAFWFFVGHVLYCTTLIVLYGISPWVIAVILPLCALYTFGNKKIGKLDYKNLTAGVLLYSVIESLSFALCFVSVLTDFSVSALILTIGFTLFYISDMVLMHNYFGEKRRMISILCHSTYYPAQILIALSIMFLV